MITLFNVNDIAILSKSDSLNNQLRFSPNRQFPIPEENKKLIERILSEDITATDETDFPELVQKIIQAQPENLIQLAHLLKFYPDIENDSVVYDYCFKNWTKNSAGIIDIKADGLNFNNSTLLQQADCTINLNQPFTLAYKYMLLADQGTYMPITFGTSATSSTSYITFLQRITRAGGLNICNFKTAIKYKGNGTTSEYYLQDGEKNVFTILLNKPYDFFTTYDGTEITMICTTEEGTFSTTFTPTSKITAKRLRINANNAQTTVYSQDWSLQKFKLSSVYNDLNFDFNENCLYYLDFMKE